MSPRAWPPRAKLAVLLALALSLVALASALPRIGQPASYHDFADQRACLGVPNCLDSASNALFLVAGLAGLRFLRGAGGRHAFLAAAEAVPYTAFFGATALVGVASGTYHLAPDNAGLAWDRAAIALAFMAWFAALIGERVSPAAGVRALPVLLPLGLAAVLYWAVSEAAGDGDLRPYALVQLLPLLGVPLLTGLYPPRYTQAPWLFAVIGLYGLVLAFDLGDKSVFALSGERVSGHTLKHVTAALAAFGVIRYLSARRPR